MGSKTTCMRRLVTTLRDGPGGSGAVVVGDQEQTHDLAKLLAQGAIGPVLAAH